MKIQNLQTPLPTKFSEVETIALQQGYDINKLKA